MNREETIFFQPNGGGINVFEAIFFKKLKNNPKNGFAKTQWEGTICKFSPIEPSTEDYL